MNQFETGDGTLAMFVNAQNDACFIDTDAGPGVVESCLGVPGLVHSVAISPDGRLAAFVLLDPVGQPTRQTGSSQW